MKVTEIEAHDVAHVDDVRFAQNLHLSPNVHCQQCAWEQPWDGEAMIEHALSHMDYRKIQDLLAETECMDCVVEVLNSGLNGTRCEKH